MHGRFDTMQAPELYHRQYRWRTKPARTPIPKHEDYCRKVGGACFTFAIIDRYQRFYQKCREMLSLMNCDEWSGHPGT